MPVSDFKSVCVDSLYDYDTKLEIDDRGKKYDDNKNTDNIYLCVNSYKTNKEDEGILSKKDFLMDMKNKGYIVISDNYLKYGVVLSSLSNNDISINKALNQIILEEITNNVSNKTLLNNDDKKEKEVKNECNDDCYESIVESNNDDNKSLKEISINTEDYKNKEISMNIEDYEKYINKAILNKMDDNISEELKSENKHTTTFSGDLVVKGNIIFGNDNINRKNCMIINSDVVITNKLYITKNTNELKLKSPTIISGDLVIMGKMTILNN